MIVYFYILKIYQRLIKSTEISIKYVTYQMFDEGHINKSANSIKNSK
jgi:hypothetical protein